MAKIPFHGIVAVGNTKTDAIAQYRELAKGKGASVFVDAGKSLSFVSNSSALAHVFNPMTGEMDMREVPALAKSLSFASESSSENREVNYYECKSSCGGHVVYDADQMLKFCPICTATVSMSGSDEDEMSEDSEDTDDTGAAEDDDSLDLGVDEDADDSVTEDDDEGEESDSDDEGDDAEDGAGEGEGEDGEDDSDELDDGEDDDASESSDDSDDDADDDFDEEDDDEGEGEESDSDDDEDMPEDDEDAGEDDEDAGEDEDADDDDDEDPVVVAASSKQEALQLYMKHCNAVVASENEVEVEYKVCSSAECGAHIISESSDTCNCPVCDSKLVEPKAESAAAAPAAAAKKATKPTSTKPLKVQSEDDAGEDTDEEDVLDVPDGDGDEDDSEDSSESSSTPSKKIPVSGKNSKPKVSKSDDSGDDSDDEDDSTGEDVEDNAMDDVDAEDNDSSESSADKSKHLDVSFSSSINGKPQWTAWYKGTPIATCTAETAGANADVFQTPEFGRTVVLAAKHAGVKPALTELGFKPIVRRVSFSSAMTKQVAQKMDVARAAIDKEQREYRERFQAALATAAVGTTRGFFTGSENPLKASLQKALATAGVRNPDVLLNQAFKSSADEYHKMLFAKASEILGKPAEVQESLARAVLEVNFVESSSAQSESTSSTETRLASMGTRPLNQEQPATATQESSTSADQATQASSFTTSLAKVVSSLGRSGRF